jgi:hypothetical protein
MESRRLHLQMDEQTVQSFESPRGFEFLMDNSVVQFLTESFDLFGARPQGLLDFLGRFHCFFKSFYCEMSWGGWNGSNPEYEKGSPLGLNGRCAEAIKPALIFWAGYVDSLVRSVLKATSEESLFL